MRLVVGCNGAGASARDAVALAVLLARTYDAEVVLGVVLPRIAPWEDFHSHEELLGAGSTDAFARAIAELERRAPELTFERRAIGGESPGDGLRDLAISEGADVIVIGSTHRGALGRMVPGTTADELVVRAPCPFAVAPRGYADREDRELRVVGVAYDGSTEARRAALLAKELALRACTGLRAFGVLQPLAAQMAPGMGAVPFNTVAFKEWLEQELDALLEELPSSIGGQKVILSGQPATALIEQGRRAADVIVFGTHGFGRLLRLVGGSVTSDVVRGAPWPVIVVPPKGPLPFVGEPPLTREAHLKP